MKKMITGILLAALILGGTATYVFAETTDYNYAEERRSFMEEQHPELSEEELDARIENCHGQGGYGNSNRHGMMNGKGFRGGF